MIAADLTVLDVHPDHWVRLLRLVGTLAAGLRRPLPAPAVLASAVERAAPQLRPDQDPAAQLWLLAGGQPGLPFALLQAAFDALWPDGTCLVLMAVDEDLEEVWTSAIARKQRGDVDLLTTDRRLGPEGFQPVAWREDLPRLLATVARRVAPVHAGVFCTRAALEGWAADPLRPGALSRPRAGGEAVLDPWPWRLSAAGHALRAWLGLVDRLRRTAGPRVR